MIKKDETIMCETNRRQRGESKEGMVSYSIYVEKENGDLLTMSTFGLIEMPGCCGIAISTGAWIEHDYRKRGLGTLLNHVRLDIATDMGYSLLLCTDLFTNEPQRKILTKNGWLSLCRFRNKRTGNTISVDCVPLREDGVTVVINDSNYYLPVTRIGKACWAVRKYFRKLLRME
jgi:hypothetical protein